MGLLRGAGSSRRPVFLIHDLNLLRPFQRTVRKGRHHCIPATVIAAMHASGAETMHEIKSDF